MDNFESAKLLFLDGLNLLEKESYQEAELKFIESLKLLPDRVSTLTNLSAAQIKLKKYLDVRLTAQQAIELDGLNSEAFVNLGLAEKGLHNLTLALDCFNRAILLNPGHVESYLNKGASLNELKRYDEALASYEKALSIKSDYAEAWSNRGVTFNELKRYDEALASYEKALSLKPEINWLYGSLLHAKMKICSWSGFEGYLEIISNKVSANEKVVTPFPALSLIDNAFLHKQSSEIYAKDKYLFNTTLGPIPKRPKNEKIRIGYFSTDFKNHPVSALIAELFELHNKNIFETIAFSFGSDDKSPMRLRLNQAFTQFIDVTGMSDMEVAKLSRELKIDIAVDLSGYTYDCRTTIFSYLAAPIQINYLGYPGTMGANYIDYIIADKTLIPTRLQQHYSEKVVYLPNSYQVNDRRRIISDKKFSRQELGLPEQDFVFCCFNNNYKILPATFESWMRILKAVDGSVLWLFQDNSWAAENLKKEAERREVNAKRLVFAERMSLPDHLARHRQADLFIDTLPYNAHTTASDALWAGLPVLTLMGESFASRVAASLLNAIGLPELIASTQDEYEALAIEFALNSMKLREIKQKLANNLLTTTLFDTPLFTKSIESAYIKIYERYYAGLPPDHIYIN